MYIAKEYQQSAGMRDWKITATEYEKDSTKENYNNSVYKYLNSFKKKYENKLAIKDDMIAYVGFDEKEKNWLLNSGIYMSKKFAVQYINEYGEKLFPDEEIAELDTEYVFYPKEKEGYISLQPEISGTATENTTVTFEYCKVCDDLAFVGLDSSGNETTDESLIQKYTVSGIGNCQNTWIAVPRTHNGKDVIKIKQGAFANKAGIKRMVICNNIEDIGSSAFYRCGMDRLFVDVKNKLTGTYIFEECNNLKNVILGNGISYLPGEMFLRCSKLETVQFYTEQNISFGNTRFFDECTSLKQFLVNSKNRKYKSVDGVLYTKDGSKLVVYPVGKTDEVYTLSTDVKEVGSYVFSYSNIKTINYEGTMEEWDNVIKQFRWNLDSKIKTIHCTDGDINI